MIDNLKKYPAVFLSAYIIVIILALVPFHAFLTVWFSSIVSHYTLLRLWKEFLLVICSIGAGYLVLIDGSVRKYLFSSRLVQLIFVFFVIELIWGLVARSFSAVNTKALFYGWLSDCRYLLFFIVTLAVAKKTSLLKNSAIKLLLWPAAIVIVFGLLQILVFPKGFLSHFGYGPKTIYPYQTINNNQHYVRILSTLRGSDPLGAYLLLPLSLVTVLLIRGSKRWFNVVYILAGLVVMLFSFSRSAWLGLVVVLALAILWGAKSKIVQKKLIFVFVGLVIVLGGIFIAERNNPKLQNIVFHSQKHSLSPISSDQGHSSALKNGLKQVLKEPLGKGPGTAGPASVYNKHPSRIAENYYIQIGQETGWLGLIAFLAINVLVAISLWFRREDSLALAMLASFLGLAIVNMLAHAWADDTLSYLWWGLAAIVIASAKPKLNKSSKLVAWII